MTETTYSWELVSTDFGYGLRCSNCGFTISVKDWEYADQDTRRCPKCDKQMDLDSVDEDEILSMAEGER